MALCVVALAVMTATPSPAAPTFNEHWKKNVCVKSRGVKLQVYTFNFKNQSAFGIYIINRSKKERNYKVIVSVALGHGANIDSPVLERHYIGHLKSGERVELRGEREERYRRVLEFQID